ncbi:hypothetical protein Y027_5263 [Burkholderia pseudomallei TSV5]|nr:hypothetical protein Y027_5263 [Burkholderia pseudomallei TSV5]
MIERMFTDFQFGMTACTESKRKRFRPNRVRNRTPAPRCARWAG